MSTKVPVTVSLLLKYYCTVQPLEPYLSELLDIAGSTSHCLVDDDLDSESYKTLLSCAYVGTNVDIHAVRRMKATMPLMHMREIIDKAQSKLLSRKMQNIITCGYKQGSSNGDFGKHSGAGMVVNYFINTIVTALQSLEWEILFSRIGEDAMFHLLTETSIFVPLPNGCLCQITGEPLTYMKELKATTNPLTELIVNSTDLVHPRLGIKRRARGDHPDERPTKRLKLDQASKGSSTFSYFDNRFKNTSEDSSRRTPADIVLIRARMLYSRPARSPHRKQLIVGISPKHILNQLAPSYRRQPKISHGEWADPDPRKQMDDARHLAKYIFPRQYGLDNVFIITRRYHEGFKLPDFTTREVEIKKKGSCKTPKRLKAVLSHVEKIIWRHGKCNYKCLLEKACPSKIKLDSNKQLDDSIILEMMSEHSIQLRSQAISAANISVDSAGRTIIARGLSQALLHVKHKPQFAEFVCSYAEVYRYAVLVTNAVIPKAFWGCNKNLKIVLRNVKKFICARRYESLTLHNVLQEFSTSECDWLIPQTRGAQSQSRVPVTDSIKRRELLEEFMYWYFDSFLISLLKTTFYVTESAAFRNKVLYFRQDDWDTLCAPLVERLTCDTFHQMNKEQAEEILRQRNLGFSFIRLLPKETGVRPIVNLRRKKPSSTGRSGQSINQILQAAFSILEYEKRNQAPMLGASVFGPDEVYKKLKAFKNQLAKTRPSGKLPKLYFVKVDVQACFDSIDQTKLLAILRDLISEDTYMMQTHIQINLNQEKTKKRPVRMALPDDDHPHFLSFAAKLAETLKNTIFVDRVTYPFSTKQEVMALLEEHITENIVKIGHDYFCQVVGIPQGSVLSAILCSFFYGDLEQQHLKFTEDKESVLMRWIDDYLLITSSLHKAQKFLEMMKKGHPEYGCFISRDKTLTNFDDYDPDTIVTEPHQKAFPWCGFLINMTDLSVSADYSRFHENYLQDSLTVDNGRHAGGIFMNKIFQLAKSKSHVLFSDHGLNSKHTIYLNIYQNFLVTAMKMHHYLRSWGIDIKKGSSRFVSKVIKLTIRCTSTTMRHKASSSKVAQTCNVQFDVSRNTIIWLGTHAFHTVLSCKSYSYPRIIKTLAFDLSLPRYRTYKKRFKGVIKDGLGTIALLAF